MAPLVMADGWVLRTARWEGRRGSILFITGRGDFFEKYCESLHDWTEAGWGVATFDWRGQGGSGRLGRTPGHGHLDDFEPLRADLAVVFEWFHKVMPGPHFAVAHSMGGHLLLRHLAEQPQAVARAVLLAPMIGISAAPLGPGAAGRLARLMVRLGRGGEWVMGAGPYGQGADKRQPLLTSDAARYADEKWWVAQHPELAIGGITWGWLAAALRSIAVLRPVQTPLLVLMAETEALVDNAATRRLFADAQIVAGAAHELLRERHVVRQRVMKMIKGFLSTP
ncbi:lysophospholipase [Polymorphobacter multimanifer]|nr:lysophospholipase [Polymorphobacter multimanifer]